MNTEDPAVIAVICILFFGTLFGGAWWIVRWLAKKFPAAADNRQGHMLNWAMTKGYNCEPGRHLNLAGRFPGLSLLKEKNVLFQENVVRGTSRGVSFQAFEHVFTARKRDYSEKNKYVDVMTSCGAVVVMTTAELPSLLIRAEVSDDDTDIDLESNEFNNAFDVTSSDRRGAFDLLHPRSMELLLQRRPTKIECGGRHVLVMGNTAEKEGLEELLETAVAFVQLILGYVGEKAQSAGR